MRQHLAQQIEEEESEINITPMLDVVFIMLIFFIVTATFVKEAGIEVNRPDAATTQAQVENLLQNQSFEEDEVIFEDAAYEGWYLSC